MKLYIYHIESGEIVAIINGENNEECEARAEEMEYDMDEHAWSYTPGNVLWETTETKEI